MSKTSFGGLIATGLIIVATMGASFFGGALWERTQHQVKDLKATAVAATDTTHQTITNAAVGQAEEGKLITHAHPPISFRQRPLELKKPFKYGMLGRYSSGDIHPNPPPSGVFWGIDLGIPQSPSDSVPQ